MPMAENHRAYRARIRSTAVAPGPRGIDWNVEIAKAKEAGESLTQFVARLGCALTPAKRQLAKRDVKLRDGRKPPNPL